MSLFQLFFRFSLARRLASTLTSVRRRWLVLAIIGSSHLAVAQEGLRNFVAGDQAADMRRLRPESLPYTFKAGEVRVLTTPSLGFDWNDNINLQQDNAQSDFIVRPLLGINLTYPVTQHNLLQLNGGVGYKQYLQHNELSGVYLQSGSELSFDIFVQDVRINLHDRFAYTQDSASEAAVAGTGQYSDIHNTPGLLVSWDLHDVTLSLGYDHENTFSPGNQFQSQAKSSDLFLVRSGLRIHPQLTAGVEATASFTRYDEMILNDNSSYSAGAYADWQLGPAFHVLPRGGYTFYNFQDTSQSSAGISTSGSISTADLGSWYAGLTVTHQLTEVVSYSLSAGHEVRLGVQSDAIEDWYVRPSVDWKIIKNLGLQTFLTYEHGNSGMGNIQGNLTEIYDQFAGGLSLNHPITDRLSLALNYRLTLRSSTSTANREYTQNLVSLVLTYAPR